MARQLVPLGLVQVVPFTLGEDVNQIDRMPFIEILVDDSGAAALAPAAKADSDLPQTTRSADQDTDGRIESDEVDQSGQLVLIQATFGATREVMRQPDGHHRRMI
ncbi:MAG TPA: hypothetical protein VJ890_07980 [Vineibacter sp.]|nr:hypothetical protein [Vineibacter sp.]